MRASRDLKWENKMYKLKRSIVEIFNATKQLNDQLPVGLIAQVAEH